jgi:hypothetical protein
MNVGRPLVGAVSGLLLAAILVAGVSIAGGGSLHLDLAGAAGNSASSNGPTPSGTAGVPAVAPQTSVGTTQASSGSSGASPISSLNALTSQSGGSVALLLLPVALGAVLGAVFYLAYNRRIDSE